MPKTRVAHHSIDALVFEGQGIRVFQDDIDAVTSSKVDSGDFVTLRAKILGRAKQMPCPHDHDLGANRQVIAVGLKKEPTIVMCREMHL
ncbi:hypothetical protein O164_18985 [Pseudomonas taiwanensis SJ9]|uniref:Uncharacterized protein n=1 Tax=Pseudomonas taiwanensis SJ9 TaxID=1388762 RepID=V7D7D3_9PSED|nr:hypothetical protein O164_18985 [Pseudomonas taiwanensis SJ9]